MKQVRMGQVQQRDYDRMLVVDGFTYELTDESYEQFQEINSDKFIMNSVDEDFLEKHGRLIMREHGVIDSASEATIEKQDILENDEFMNSLSEENIYKIKIMKAWGFTEEDIIAGIAEKAMRNAGFFKK